MDLKELCSWRPERLQEANSSRDLSANTRKQKKSLRIIAQHYAMLIQLVAYFISEFKSSNAGTSELFDLPEEICRKKLGLLYRRCRASKTPR